MNAPVARALRMRGGRLLDALLAGRGWIVVVWVLLAGIVFFNVDLLQSGREIARGAERSAALKRENSRLRLELARLASSERIQRAAGERGLVLPPPGEVRYLRAEPSADARRAAKTLTAPGDGPATAPQPQASGSPAADAAPPAPGAGAPAG